jgi:NADPH:quinone reductase-like Zn-dependent oxidoreductase
MKAAVVRAPGQPPSFQEFPEPVPAEGEVLVTVTASGLHPVVKALAGGTHYGSADGFPLVPGVDGTGRLADGTRVYFGGVRHPHGPMAERAAVPAAMCLPLPDEVPDAMAAAIMNPGISAWLALTGRGRLAEGGTVLVLGATGAAGRIAVQLARHLGAGRIIAAGRDPGRLAGLSALGADVTIRLDEPGLDLPATIAEAAAGTHIGVIVDYLWGAPAEAAIQAVTRRGLSHTAGPVRLVEVGQAAGATITLPASVLRGSGLEISGSGAGSVPPAEIAAAVPRFMALAAAGAIDLGVDEVALADVERAWNAGSDGRRVVLIP